MAYLQPAITMRLFGDNLFGMSMEAVIAGTLTVLGVYLLARTLFDRRCLALIAAATAAIGYTDIHFSRVSAYMDPVPWLLFGLVFLVEGLRSNRAAMFALSGVSVAIGFEMYYSGRLIAVVIFLFTVYLALLHRPLLVRRWKGFVAFAAGGVLAIGPYLFFHLQNFHSFMDRTRQVYVMTPDNVTHLLGKYGTTSRARMMLEQTWRSLLTFDYTPDSSTQFGFSHPMINPILGPLLVLGVAVGVRRFRDPGQALLLIWLGTGVVLGSILTIDAPFWPRLVVLLPAVAILVAAALDRILRAAAGRKWGPAAVLVPAGLLIAGVGYQNIRWYFGGTIPTYVSPPAWVGRLIAKSPRGTGYCMVRGPLDFDDRVPQFLGRGRNMRTIAPEEAEKSEERCVAEGRVWVIIRPDHDSVLASLNRRWPGGRVENHDYPLGQPGPIFWYPPKAAPETAPPPP
jgi:4-amino-4-deoxy-L-arabinose transferase-like glycosyltransferase